MSNKRIERLSPIEIAYIIVAFTIVVASLIYVVVTKYDHRPNTISVNLSDFNSSYDVSIINQADIDDFMSVKGIGEVRANEIIAYRDALGGFEDVYELLDLKFINADLFEKIITYFYLSDYTPSDIKSPDSDSDNKEESDDSTDEVIENPTDKNEYVNSVDNVLRRSVNINTASSEEIMACLLISSAQAEQIVEIRDIIGGYSNISELSLCSLISMDLYSEIKDYVII